MRKLLLLLPLCLIACGKTEPVTPTDAGTDAPNVDTNPPDAEPPGTFHNASKVDILFAIDNSASMGDKQALLRTAVPDLLQRLVAPNCVDATGGVVGPSTNGTCANGTLEFPPVTDIHVGIVSSSLGGRGADVCGDNEPSPFGPGSVLRNNDKGHLLTRAGDQEQPLADAPSGYLSWSPLGGAQQLVSDVQELVGGVHEHGCGLEAQLESWYRFLVQPDPYADVVVDPQNGNKRALSGVDGTILQQRHDFLRPDSLVAVILITDEDDSMHDPRAVAGQGWAFSSKRFPGSIGGGAARATSACDDPKTVNTAACTSCAYPGHANDPNCQKPGDVDSSTGQPQPGYYTLAEDSLNTRYFHMRQRYGVDPQFPIQRYVNGLTSPKVPDRNGETYGGPNDTYVGNNDCTNPLFAKDLPTDPNADLCNLATGPRAADLVVFTAITGVPWQLLTENPNDPQSPFKPTLSAADWTKLVGANPEAYDYSGQDPHMQQSIAPRATLPGPSQPDTADPMNGREWDTKGTDLQYACTFALPAPKDCTDPRYVGECDCSTAGPNPPLCDPQNPRLQVRGKAYPGIRPLTLVKDLGTQGIAASLCPRTLDTSSPDYGYRPAVRALVDRVRKNLVK